MAPRSGTTQALVVILTPRAALALAGSRSGMEPAGRFPAHEQGREDFLRWLRDSPSAPLYLVADLDEEEFRSETVPRLRWPHRRVFHARKHERLFPAAGYRCVVAQDAKTAERGRELLLCAALPGNGRFSFWHAAVLESGVLPAGIASLPLLSEKFAAARHPGVENLLLLSHDEDAGLRQSYLHQGALRFSRLLAGVGAGDAVSLREILLEECGRTRQYLERQKLLAPGALLETHAYLDAALFSRCAAADCHFPPGMHHHDASALLAHCGIRQGLPAATALLLAVWHPACLPGHYAPVSRVRDRQLGRFRAALPFGAGLVAAAALAAALFFAWQARGIAGGSQDLRRKTAALRGEERLLLASLPLPAATAREALGRAHLLRNLAAAPSPMATMAMAARVLEEFPEIHLTALAWQLAAEPETGLSSGEGAGPEDLLAGLAQGRAGISFRLSGAVDGLSLREAQEAVARCALRLEEETGFTVIRERMPVETRDDGGLQASVADSPLKNGAPFALRLVGGGTP